MLRAVVQIFSVSAVARTAAFGLAYLAAAEIRHALSFRIEGESFAALRPTAGLLVATLALSPYRRWPAFLLAALAAHLVSDRLVHGDGWPVCVGTTVATSAEACLGAWLLRRFIDPPISLARIKDVLAFACWSAMISTAVGAAIGAGVIAVESGAASYGVAWVRWWIGDAVGVLAVGPLVFAGAAAAASLASIRPLRVVESVVAVLGIVIAAEGVYGGLLPPPLNVPIVLLPFLLWAALRLGPTGAAAAIVIVALIGVWNLLEGRGPFMDPAAQPAQRALRAQGALGVSSLTLLILGAAVAERRKAEQDRMSLIVELQHAVTEIKTLRGMIPICAWCKRVRDDKDFWHAVEDYVAEHTEANFTHGMCPDCLTRVASELKQERP